MMKYFIILILFSVNGFSQTTSTVLNGSGSYDPDGQIVSYLWTKISGKSCTIVKKDSVITQVTGLAAGVYKFELKVVDNNGAIGKDTVQVTIIKPKKGRGNP